MTKVELADYLANLSTLIDFHEDFGGPRNKWVLAEYNVRNEEFIQMLKDEHDETRKS
jgi:hypothetical protein